MKFDPGKLAQGIQQAEKLVSKVASGEVPKELLDSLRKLLEDAKRLLQASGGKNRVLEEGISEAEKLLEKKDVSVEDVTRMVSKLSKLVQEAGKKQPEAPRPAAAKPAAPAPSAAKRTTPAAPAVKAAEPAKEIRFSDVKEGAYYFDAVQWAVQKGIVLGTSETTFSPDENCTRGQALLILWRAEGSPAPESRNNPFSDVPQNAYYLDAALWAAERGLVTGSVLQPEGVVTRGQMVTFLYRNAGSPAVSGTSSFSDVPANAWFAEPVAWATAKHITSGTSATTFSPDAGCTRGQIVTLLYKAMG